MRAGQAAPSLCGREGQTRSPTSGTQRLRAAARRRVDQTDRVGGRRWRLNKTIEITVDAKGAVVVETKGFTGSSCKVASRFLEQALGDTTAEQLTAEFH